VAAVTGHIASHEAGAIEAGGHKVLTLPEYRGKIAASDLEALLRTYDEDANHDHMVMPGMVYISQPTEYGTLYSLDELTAISRVCREAGIPLYLDGARLAYALACPANDVTLPDIARLCDAFYIGGTKCGALCGEALVFPHGAPAHFANYTKKRLAMLAKGRVFGVQFDALFTDGLYWEIGRHGIEAAERLKEILRRHGLPMFRETPTNQQFVVLENEALARLREQVAVSYWSRADETHTVVRLATSWSTTEADLETLDRALGG
jgi:threonine aldolase